LYWDAVEEQRGEISNMNMTLLKAVMKARRSGLLRLVEATEPTRMECLKDICVKCCMNLGSPVVTVGEAENIDESLIDKSKDFMFIKSKDSVCCLLDEGLCSMYANRPSGCAEYPWYNVDGKLYYDSGCPGIKHDRDERPDVSDIQPFENFFAGTPKAIVWLIRKICIRS
jgi:Fe-S-cluster containining protein